MDDDKDEGCGVVKVYVNCEKGHHKEKCCKPEFAEVYSNAAQSLAASAGLNLAGGIALLENTITATPDIDVSLVATTGDVKIKKAGWYELIYGVGAFLNPLPSPLPVWSISIYKNGSYVPGSTVCSLPISPEQRSTEVVGDLFIHLNVGDSFFLANSSSEVLFLNAPLLGTNSQPNSAFLSIKLLKAD